MSTKVNMEAPPKETIHTPLEPPSASSSAEAVLLCGSSDGVSKNKARPQPHTTTTALLLPGINTTLWAVETKKKLFHYYILLNLKR